MFGLWLLLALTWESNYWDQDSGERSDLEVAISPQNGVSQIAMSCKNLTAFQYPELSLGQEAIIG
jgi:hypothetical protein